MAWRDHMTLAKFRGVEFYVDGSQFKGGRRGVTHEFPFKNKAWREDLGRSVRTFSLEAIVIGDDYRDDKKALQEALESDDGPGLLVHPYFGEVRVAVEGEFTISETSGEGGIARFSISFVESLPEAPQPSSVPDAVNKAKQSADNAKVAVGEDFVSRYVTNAYHKDSAAGVLRSATLAASTALARVTQTTQQAAQMKQRLDDLTSTAGSLVNSPEDALAGISGMFDAFEEGSTDALLEVYSFNPGVRPPATTPSRADEQANFDAMQLLMQRLAVIRAAQLAVDQTFESYDDALATRTALTDLLDEQCETASDDAFPALMLLRSDLVKAVPGAESDLPRLSTVTPPSTVPSLVLAHQLYGDLDLEADLVARNRIRNPLAVMGGRELEVLSRG